MEKELLASVEIHGKCDISGLLNLYPQLKPITILRLLFKLQSDGWIVVRKTQAIDGLIYNRPNVRRTKKKLYTQLELL